MVIYFKAIEICLKEIEVQVARLYNLCNVMIDSKYTISLKTKRWNIRINIEESWRVFYYNYELDNRPFLVLQQKAIK